MPRGTTPSKVAISPQMKHAWKRYESGDVVLARREAENVLDAPPSPADAAQAKDLLERTKIPRSALLYALLAAALISLLILVALLRS